MSTREHYDVVIIGCGMSGLAAGIRLAHFGKRVIIYERHNAPGGLNSFYSFDGRKYDVGLHAVTNYVRPGVKGTPLVKLLRQLRISRDDLGLCEQVGSKVAFPGVELSFANDFAAFEAEIAEKFPREVDNFRRLVKHIMAFDDVALEGEVVSAREVVGSFIGDRLLEDMLFCPLMYYGSAIENDMDFGQFAIMFKSIFMEGFARPYEGVRTIIRALLDKYRAVGGKRKMKCGVRRIAASKGRVAELVLDNGETVTADHVLSSAGVVETLRLCDDYVEAAPPEKKVGKLSFVETISVLDRQPKELGWEDTIIFFNDHGRFEYQSPEALVDPRSGVICFPNNYRYAEGQELEEGLLRVTAMANYDGWTALPEDEYRARKEEWYSVLQRKAQEFLKPLKGESLQDITLATDMFTPRTVEKFTSHLGGAIYGSPTKSKDGRTHLENLYICGTDQGFLGIVGAMLSGISMANYHVLRG